jgi:hypothetical protein
MTDSGLVELNETEFLAASRQVPFGIPLDDPRALFGLSEAGAKMRKKDADSMVFAVVFPPGKLDSSLLDLLVGLKNVQQVQLSGTSVTDDDLQKLRVLPRLTGVGLDNTAVTDAGIEHLAGIATLQIINRQGTAITDEAVSRVVKNPAD